MRIGPPMLVGSILGAALSDIVAGLHPVGTPLSWGFVGLCAIFTGVEHLILLSQQRPCDWRWIFRGKGCE